MSQAARGRVLFEELGEQRTFELAELQARADNNPWTPKRKQYRLWLDEREAAYLSFDIFWPDQLNLYEIFVAQAFRGQGVGTAAIRFAVELSNQLRKPRLTVRPGSLLATQTEGELIKWYECRGFKLTADDPDLLEIKL